MTQDTTPSQDIPPQAALTFEHLGKTYPGQTHPALDNLNLSVPKGSRLGIIGRSGAGKSTLVRLISGLEHPGTGRLLIHGQDPAALNAQQRRERQSRTGLVFQHFNLLAQRSVLGNVTLPLELCGVPRAEREKRALELLDKVGLAHLARRYPAQLSGGQKQRVGIARALVTGPDLLLADEATSALDPETSASILNLLTDLQRERDLTLVIVTHQMEVVRAATTHIAVLDGGQLVESGATRQVLANPQHAVTRALLEAHRPEVVVGAGQQLRRLTLGDLGAQTLAALGRLQASVVQAEAHPLGVDAWLLLPDHVSEAELSTLRGTVAAPLKLSQVSA